jgi:hypothetical protein
MTTGRIYQYHIHTRAQNSTRMCTRRYINTHTQWYTKWIPSGSKIVHKFTFIDNTFEKNNYLNSIQVIEYITIIKI